MNWRKYNIRIVLLSSIGGAVLLIFFSMLQKISLGADPLIFKGYVVPVLTGGITGIVISLLFQNVQFLNARLKERVSKLEGLLLLARWSTASAFGVLHGGGAGIVIGEGTQLSYDTVAHHRRAVPGRQHAWFKPREGSD